MATEPGTSPSYRSRPILLVLLGVLVAAVVAMKDIGSAAPSRPASNTRRSSQSALTEASQPTGRGTQSTHAAVVNPASLDVHLESLAEPRPVEGATERNPFRFRPPPPPPPAPTPPKPTGPPTPAPEVGLIAATAAAADHGEVHRRDRQGRRHEAGGLHGLFGRTAPIAGTRRRHDRRPLSAGEAADDVGDRRTPRWPRTHHAGPGRSSNSVSRRCSCRSRWACRRLAGARTSWPADHVPPGASSPPRAADRGLVVGCRDNLVSVQRSK